MTGPDDIETVNALYERIVRAIAGLDPDGTGEGGFVDERQAVAALCMVAGAIIGGSAPDQTKRQMREAADHCRQLILAAITSTAANPGEVGFHVDRVQ